MTTYNYLSELEKRAVETIRLEDSQITHDVEEDLDCLYDYFPIDRTEAFLVTAFRRKDYVNPYLDVG